MIWRGPSSGLKFFSLCRLQNIQCRTGVLLLPNYLPSWTHRYLPFGHTFIYWQGTLFGHMIFGHMVLDTWYFPRFLQIRLGSESCDQISASPNRPKPAKSRDKTAGSLFTRVYTLVEFSQTKRCFFSFLKQNIQKQNDTSTSLSLTQHNSYFIKNKIVILFFLFFCLFCLQSFLLSFSLDIVKKKRPPALIFL